MYQVPQDRNPGCRDTLFLTRAAFSVLIPIFGAMIGIMSLVILTIYLLLSQPPFALLPIALLVGAIALYARWDRRRGDRPPPEF